MRIGTSLVLLAGLACPGLAQDGDVTGRAFVDAFAEACVPGRLSYEGTRQAALDAGWTAVEDGDDPELAALMALAREEMHDPENPDWKGEAQVFSREVPGRAGTHYLVATYLVAPDVINMIGCHLYDFSATEIIDPALVSALTGNDISQSVDQDGVVNHVWGPACPWPRTFDTHLTLIREASAAQEFTGFSGLMLKFETSEPAAGEVVPDTYC